MRRALIAASMALFVVSCAGATPAIGAFRTASVVLHGSQGPVHVEAQVADSPAKRERGLMDRTSLGANQGMIFLFDDVSDGPVTSEFWMKDTLIPLSVAFWDATGTYRGYPGHGSVHEGSVPDVCLAEALHGRARGELGILRRTRGDHR